MPERKDARLIGRALAKRWFIALSASERSAGDAADVGPVDTEVVQFAVGHERDQFEQIRAGYGKPHKLFLVPPYLRGTQVHSALVTDETVPDARLGTDDLRTTWVAFYLAAQLADEDPQIV